MFVTALILLVIAIMVFIAMLGTSKENSTYRPSARRPLKAVSGVLAFLAVIFLIISSVTVVSTKNVGIVTTFGRPSRSLSNGLHIKAPWQSVTELDAAIQTDAHTKENHNTCLTARIAHQAVACVDTTIVWRINERSSDELFKDYRDFDRIRDSLVTRELSTAINATLGAYDPLAVDTNGNSTTTPLNASAVKALVQSEVGSKITVLSVFIPVLHFDPDTQSRINALQSQIAQTRIATQAEQTAIKQAAANRAISTSVSNDPNVLVNKCFDLLNELSNKNQAIPTGFSCWPGGSSAVVVPSGSTARK